MHQEHASHFAQVNGIRMHYLDYAGPGPAMLLLHSVSGNAHVFHGLVANGLSGSFRLVIPDLRGRGQTERPSDDYSLERHSQDLIGLLDNLLNRIYSVTIKTQSAHVLS